MAVVCLINVSYAWEDKKKGMLSIVIHGCILFETCLVWVHVWSGGYVQALPSHVFLAPGGQKFQEISRQILDQIWLGGYLGSLGQFGTLLGGKLG